MMQNVLFQDWRSNLMDAVQQISIRNKIIGILIKRTRLNAGKSQRVCADLLGCSPFTFGQYERGRRGLSLPQLEALAYLFDVPVENLLNDNQAPPAGPREESLPMDQIMMLRRKMLAVQFRKCRQIAGLSQREIAGLVGCSARTISLYERGQRDIPLAELEIVARQCGQQLADFLDEQTAPLGQAEQERQILAHLNELPPDVRDFVLKPSNALYLRVAMLLSAMKADSLRQIAETILDITY
jgi:transcriptional regulator with XRE-family HTH domain